MMTESLGVSYSNATDYDEPARFVASSSSTTTNDDDDYLLYTSSLTDRQEIVLNILRLTSSALSIFGSVTIMYKVIRNRENTTPYDRIMLGLSFSDIVASLSFMMSPFLIPADTSPRVWAMGSTTTCSFLGWLSQLGFSTVWYNCLLSFYYLFTVRFGMSRHVFARKYEPWFHLSTWIFFLTTASVGAAFGLYAEFQINLGCWLACEVTGTCIGKALLVGWIFAGIPTLFTFLALPINNLFIYAYVRKTLRQPTSIGKPCLTNKSATTSPQPTTGSGSGRSPEQGTTARDRQQQSTHHRHQHHERGTRSSIDYVEEVRRQRHLAHVKEVATQGFLYVATFFLSYTPAFAVRMIDAVGKGASDEANIYPLLLVNAILVPLQGFFNMFVHTRPSYIRFRAAYPEFSRSWAMSHALFDKDIPRYSKAKFTPKARSNDQILEGGGGDDGKGVHWRVSSSHNSHSGSWYSSAFGFSSYLDPVQEEKSHQEDNTSDDLQLQGLDRHITFVVASPSLPMEMTSISLIDDEFELPGGMVADSPNKQETAALDDNTSPTRTAATLLEWVPVNNIDEGISSEQSSIPASVEAEVSFESGQRSPEDSGAFFSQASTGA